LISARICRACPQFRVCHEAIPDQPQVLQFVREDIEIIRNRVHFFCKNRKWYDEKGIPYTLGLLLSGSPGTGKTSTIKCLANETNRHICNVNLNNDMTKTQLENLFFNENLNVMNPITGQAETYCIPLDQRIYVLEDVDCQSDIVMERTLKNENKNKNADKEPRDTNKAVLEHYEDKHKVDLSFLLNLLDGVLENPGRIVIMTSNFPDTLDSALIRPGRIDVIAKFRNCSNATVRQMLEFFYDTRLSEEDADRIHRLKEEIITPAEMSKVMFENFSDIQASITHMENLSKNKLREREEWENRRTIKLTEEPDTPILPVEEPGDLMRSLSPSTSDSLKNKTDGASIIEENSDACSETKRDTVNTSDKPDNEAEILDRMKNDMLHLFVRQILPTFVNEAKVRTRDNFFTEICWRSTYSPIAIS
jgi:DNA polymerase III delta prime subunit